jgi:Signal transduction histidine kinase
VRLKIGAFKKISWKLTLIYALIFSAVLILLNAGTLFGLRYFLIEQAQSQVANSAASTLRILAPRIEQGSLNDPDILSKVEPTEEMNIRLADARGNGIASTGRTDSEAIPVTSNPGATTVVETGEMHLIIRNDPIRQNGKIIAYLQVVYDMRTEYFFIKALFVLMAIADAAGVIISVFAGILISKKMLGPIDRITKAAKNISISDLNSSIEVGEADDELTRLAVTFNEMIGRLRSAFERQNRFVSDASHELRTPISVIRGYADVVDRWGKNDAAVLEESITAIKRETDGMSTLVERLLFLAKGESGTARLQAERFDAGKLVAEVAAESRLIAPDRQIDFVAGTAEMHADQKLIKQMLRALIDNSIKFTPPDGKIELKIYKENAKIVFTVTDNGIGIPKTEIEHIFDRFYVVDKARSKEDGGCGLGLSIVKWIAEVHGGSISAQSPPSGGTVFTAAFPDTPVT